MTLSVFILGSITLAYLVCSILAVAIVNDFMFWNSHFTEMTLTVFREMNSPVIPGRVIIDRTGAFTVANK